MSRHLDPPGNVVLLRGACLWLLVALVLAWCMVGLFLQIPVVQGMFPGKFSRLLQGHIDFLLMTALIFGIYATKTALPWHVRWAMVIGAFTNSSLFVLMAMFPAIDSPTPPTGFFPSVYQIYLYASLVVTSYGFGRAAVLILLSTLDEDDRARLKRLMPGAGQRSAADTGTEVRRTGLARTLSPARRFAMRRRIAQFLAPAGGRDPLAMWLIFSGLSVFAFVLLWFYGLAQKVIEGDPTRISLVIVGLYLATSLHCLFRARQLSREASDSEAVAKAIRSQSGGLFPRCAVATYVSDLTTKSRHAQDKTVDPGILLKVLAERLRGSNDLGAFASDSLMKLGLLGTIIGFIIMLAPIAGLDPGNAAAMKTSMRSMTEGMAIAMYTTLVGLVGSLLVKLQYMVVEKAASRIFTSAVELTEVYITPSIAGRMDVAA